MEGGRSGARPGCSFSLEPCAALWEISAVPLEQKAPDLGVRKPTETCSALEPYDSSPGSYLTATAWEIPSKNFQTEPCQLTESWQIIINYITPISFGVVDYTVDNQNAFQWHIKTHVGACYRRSSLYQLTALLRMCIRMVLLGRAGKKNLFLPVDPSRICPRTSFPLLWARKALPRISLTRPDNIPDLCPLSLSETLPINTLLLFSNPS